MAHKQGPGVVSDDFILLTENLTKEFAGFVAVNGVSLQVSRGTIHALIGPNAPASPPASTRRAMALIADVGLSSFAHWTAVELPYGRKRALEIATTLALDPEMLLLDEPMAGMGHEDIDRISALIKSVAAQRTVLMVEHNLSVVANLSDRITVLTRGRVLAEGDYKTVSSHPLVREAYLGVGHA